MAIACGMADGLPVSLMLVGRHFDEPTIHRAAFIRADGGLEDDVRQLRQTEKRGAARPRSQPALSKRLASLSRPNHGQGSGLPETCAAFVESYEWC